MKTNLYKKQCPVCNKDLLYTTAYSLKIAIKINSKCRSCSKKGKLPPFFKNGKIPESILDKMKKTWFKKGQEPSNAKFRKGKNLEEIYGVEKTKQIRTKFSLRRQSSESNENRRASCIKAGCGKSNKGRKTSPELKKLFRHQMIARLKQTNKNFHPPYNKKACEYFNKLMIENNCHIQHALNGGEYYVKELGYWVDGYDKQNNIVYEWDEKRHYNSVGMLKDKDVVRQNEIENFLKCKFIRIKE